MSTVVEFLENYWSRDQAFRTVQYGAQALSGWSGVVLGWERAGRNLSVVSSSISNMRIINRLFDDLPNLLEMLRQVKSIRSSFHIEKVLPLISSAAYQLYYPVEHMAWMADAGILPYSSGKMWTAACYLWLLAVVAGLVSHLRRLIKSCVTAWHMHRTYGGGGGGGGGSIYRRRSSRSPDGHYVVNYSSIFTACLNVIQTTADLLMALEFSYFQSSLWPDRPAVGNLVVGHLGFLSSIIGLFRIMPTTTGYFTTGNP